MEKTKGIQQKGGESNDTLKKKGQLDFFLFFFKKKKVNGLNVTEQ